MTEFPEGFFSRTDDTPDDNFYGMPRLVTHIDNPAIAAAGTFYDSLDMSGRVLDLMSSWISHLLEPPQELTVLGMNQTELDANPMAHERLVHDLNLDPQLPFPDASFDRVICTVSVDYLTQPLEVFAEVARVLVPGGIFACTFSNRCFPTKAIRGWLMTDDQGHCDIVAKYFTSCAAFEQPIIDAPVPPGSFTNPLYAVWAQTKSS